MVCCVWFELQVPASDRRMIGDKCDDTIKWLDQNQTAEKEQRTFYPGPYPIPAIFSTFLFSQQLQLLP